MYEGITYEGLDSVTEISTNGSGIEKFTSSRNKTRKSDQNLTEITRLLIFAADAIPEVVHEDPIPEAFHLLGMMCEYGLLRWDQLILHVERSHPDSLFKSLVRKGHHQLAQDLYHHAVELHYAESMYHLGLMNAYGRGVQLNYAKAVEYFRRAALEHNHAPSMRYLGLFAFNGYVSPKDEIDFYMAEYWFRQCIEWSPFSAISLKDDKNNVDNTMNQLCRKDLEQVTVLHLHSKNWSAEVRDTTK